MVKRLSLLQPCPPNPALLARHMHLLPTFLPLPAWRSNQPQAVSVEERRGSCSRQEKMQADQSLPRASYPAALSPHRAPDMSAASICS